MGTAFHRRFLSILLSLTMLLCCIPTDTFADGLLLPPETEATVPGETSSDPVPENTSPGTLASEEPVIPTAYPDEPQPDASLPAESVPEESMPNASLPSESLSEESIPKESTPETVPADPFLSEPDSPDEPVASQTIISSEPEDSVFPGIHLYFGQLHGHSDLSSSTESLESVFQTAEAEGLDFLAVTDHSASFDGHLNSQIAVEGGTVSENWAAGKAAAAAAAAATSDHFVGIFGYEMNWPRNMQLGHISTFNTPGFQSWQQDAFRKYSGALPNYYAALAASPNSVSQFCHPGTDFGTFCDFSSYSPEADKAVTLLELGRGQTACRYYIKALDLGWHLAPTGSSGGRTVICASALTEHSLYDAMENYRVYASEDADLAVLYSMDGYFMGSSLELRHIGDAIDISVTCSDLTDKEVGLLEVITGGGHVAASQMLASASGTLTFSLPPASGYYFLRLTQPDGDIAVTAPIWVDAEEELGISTLTCETSVPVQEEPTALSVTISNQETADFVITALEILADGTPAEVQTTFPTIPGQSTLTHSFSFCCSSVGQTQIALRLSGTLDGSPRTFETSMTLSFRQSPQVTGILVDGSHGNAGLDSLNLLKNMATQEHIRLTVSPSEVTADELKDCRFLLISAPSEPFSMQFLGTVADYVAYGGSILLCGQADSLDPAFQSAAELNRLLAAVGSSLRLRDDLILDSVNNGGTPELLFPDAFSPAAMTEHITHNQVYRLSSGCSVTPGSGSWLVKSRSTTRSVDGDGDGSIAPSSEEIILLASESLPGGGRAIAAGSLFLSDENLAAPKNIWDEPYANHTIARNLLGIGGDPVPLYSIADARISAPGTLVRIRGYVTAGTSNPNNTFPDTLYLQDETGGIAAVPFSAPGIQTGTPLELTGILESRDSNPVLKIISHSLLDAAMYQYQPRQGSWKSLLDPAVNGGSLVEAEGTCLEVYCREDRTLAGCLLKDGQGNQILVQVEDQIRNSADGGNDLHISIRKGRTVRAAGLLHVNELGETVIRVRNCEEVVYVPPRRLFSLNPKTGDFLLPVAAASMAGSLAGLLLLKKRKMP